MSYQFIKSLQPSIPNSKIEEHSYVTSYCSWERLKEYLGEAIGLKDNEDIIGVKVTDNGVTAIIKQNNHEKVFNQS